MKSPQAIKNALLKEHMQNQNNAKLHNLRAQAAQEQFSLKTTTNKDLYMAYEIETVSDWYASVELKKANRE